MRRHGTLLALSLSLAACENTALVAPTPPPTLSVAEARDVLIALSGVSSIDYRYLLDAPAPLAATVHAAADIFTDSVPCPMGGVTIVTGFMDFEESGEVDIVLRDDFRGCALEDAAGRAWTFDAVSPLRAHLQMLVADDELVFVGSVVGAVRFTSGDASGTCGFSLVLATPEEPEAAGTICGHAVAALREAKPLS